MSPWPASLLQRGPVPRGDPLSSGAAGPHLYDLAPQGTALAPPWGLRTGSDGRHQHLSAQGTGLLLPDPESHGAGKSGRAWEGGQGSGVRWEGPPHTPLGPGWGADLGLTPPGPHTPGASHLTHVTGLPQVPLPEWHLLSACRAPSTQDGVCCQQLLGQGSRSTDPQTLGVSQPSDPRQRHQTPRRQTRRQTRPCAPSAAEPGEVEAPPSTQASEDAGGPKPSGHRDTVACNHSPEAHVTSAACTGPHLPLGAVPSWAPPPPSSTAQSPSMRAGLPWRPCAGRPEAHRPLEEPESSFKQRL